MIALPNYPRCKGHVDYYSEGMAETVKRLKRENSYTSDRSATDYRFWTMSQQDYYGTDIINKSKITNDAQYID